MLKEVRDMKAYMVNEHYIFTDYEDLSSLIYDVIHHSRLSDQHTCHSFSIITGSVQWEKMTFIEDNGEKVPLRYEPDHNLYYSNLHG